MLNLILALVSICLSCFSSLGHGCNQLDHDLLSSFSLNTSASPPLNWPSSIDCCLWEGLTCDAEGWVTNLSLPSRGLSGVLSPSIWNLTRLSHLNLSRNRLFGPLGMEFISPSTPLKTLDLSYNRLHGELPSGASLPFKNISIVDFSSNHLYGEIPSTFFQQAGNLTTFNVSNNSFIGPIPSSICLNSSFSVKLLDFSFNEFSGQIPTGLGNCSQLQVFRAGFNNLTGQIPEDIYNAVALQEISLPVNFLSGDFNHGIINIANLKILQLYRNEFTGLIPRDVGKLAYLEELTLHTLPASLSNCTNLVTLNLRVNLLAGDLSRFNFSRLRKLRILDLGNNNFTGELPHSLYLCTSLTAIRLAANQLVGQISQDILALQSLSFLSVSTNKLTNITGGIKILMGCKNLTAVILSNNSLTETLMFDGNIDQSDGFANLQVLALGGSGLHGEVPSWLANLTKLQVLDLSYNQITGSIPEWLGTMPSLFYIDSSNNLITGKIPKELAGLLALASQEVHELVEAKSCLELPVFTKPNNASTMQYNQLNSLPPAIFLGNNNLTGQIPPAIGQLKSLHVLDLSDNIFLGNIPEELSGLTELEKLDLSGNYLSGEIPSSLRALHFLSWFSVADNLLQGPVPSGGQFDTFPTSSFTGNPELCGPVLERSCDQPGITHSVNISQETSNNTLVLGLIAGVTFGFIIGFAYGLILVPIDRLQFLQIN